MAKFQQMRHTEKKGHMSAESLSQTDFTFYNNRYNLAIREDEIVQSHHKRELQSQTPITEYTGS